jgi:hypothetical protein
MVYPISYFSVCYRIYLILAFHPGITSFFHCCRQNDRLSIK